MPFEFILKLVDVALLWDYAGGSARKLSLLGLHGASDLVALFGESRQGRNARQSTLAAIKEIGIGEIRLTCAGIENIAERLRSDSYARFIRRLLDQ